jgi:hypothetical protein
MTVEQALQLKHGEILHCGVCNIVHGKRGGVKIYSDRWRVNGLVKTWKRTPGKFLIPLAKGLYQHAYMGEGIANGDIMPPEIFHKESECGYHKKVKRIDFTI